MSRSIWKGPFLDKFLLQHNLKKKIIKFIWSRRSVIPFLYLNKQVSIYNGKVFKRIFITREKIGFKFGAIALLSLMSIAIYNDFLRL